MQEYHSVYCSYLTLTIKNINTNNIDLMSTQWHKKDALSVAKISRMSFLSYSGRRETLSGLGTVPLECYREVSYLLCHHVHNLILCYPNYFHFSFFPLHFEASAHQPVISIFTFMKLADSPGTKSNHLCNIGPLFSFFYLVISSPLQFCLHVSPQSDPPPPPIVFAPQITDHGHFFVCTPGQISLFKHLAKG